MCKFALGTGKTTLHIPLSANALAFITLVRVNIIGSDTKIGTKQISGTKILVQQPNDRPMLVNVPASLYYNIVSIANLALVTLTFTPIESSNRSFTFPTPGSFRTGMSCMNSIIASRSKGNLNWPFGLFYEMFRRKDS